MGTTRSHTETVPSPKPRPGGFLSIQKGHRHQYPLSGLCAVLCQGLSWATETENDSDPSLSCKGQ